MFGQVGAVERGGEGHGQTIDAHVDATRPAAQLLASRRARRDALELADIPWLHGLEANEKGACARRPEGREGRARRAALPGRPAGHLLVRRHRRPAEDEQRHRAGIPITFTGLPPGGWFGEGTVIKREAYRYNIEALRQSTVAGSPVDTFHWLLDRSIPFNRFILQQLNERLGQFMAAREIDRLNDPDARVARSLAALFHPILYPGVGTLLRITQQELGYLVGLSRQRVNEALRALQASGLIRVEYGGVKVTDLERLRAFR